MSRSITSTDAARHLGDVLARIKHTGESFIVTKSKRPIACLGPVPESRAGTLGDVLEALSKLPHDPSFAEDLERVNQADRPLDNPWP